MPLRLMRLKKLARIMHETPPLPDEPGWRQRQGGL